MISRALALAMATAGAVAISAEAQTITAQSGEHDGFTRLVMRVPDGVDWSLTQNQRVATLNVASTTAVFDTSDVFSLIGRERITNVTQIAPGQPLRIDLGCECRLDYYQQADGYLVIDVREGTPDELPVAALAPAGRSVLPVVIPQQSGGLGFDLGSTALHLSQVEAGLETALNGGADQRDVQAQAIAADAVAQSDVAEVDEPMAAPDAREEADSSLLMDLEENQRTAMVNDTETRLLQQIDRASNQGLVLLDEQVAENGILDPLGNEDRPLNALPNFAVTSAVDRETGLRAIRRQGDGNHCLRDRSLDVENWVNSDNFAEQVGDLRLSLVNEFDRIQTKTVVKLAKTYLYFGFGAEAIATLKLVPDSSIRAKTRDILITMGHVLDEDPLPVNTVFSGQQTCPGLSAFWGAMAAGSVKKTANTDAIQQAFARLPSHLRVHFGPRMGRIFAEAGDEHVAKATLRAVERSGVEAVPDINMTEAAIATMHGDSEQAAEHLTDEVAERTKNSPIALIELIDLSFKERRAILPDVPDLTASYELESRETELGRELRRAEVAALSLAGRFDEAYSQLRALEDRDGLSARKAASVPFFTLLAENADNVTFLKYGVFFGEEATVAEAVEVADILARRLMNLGFPDEAQQFLEKLAMEEENEDRRLLSAEIALAQNEPQRALVELMGIESKMADKLRAEALWRNQEYERASGYLEKSDDMDGAARGYWHSEDIERASTLKDGAELYSGVASLTGEIEELAQAPEGLTPLAEARALVETSVGARGDIEELFRQIQRGDTDSE